MNVDIDNTNFNMDDVFEETMKIKKNRSRQS